jgi:hypothetical protein
MQIPHEGVRSTGPSADHLEALIDEAEEHSFPASDPPVVHSEPWSVTMNVACHLRLALARMTGRRRTRQRVLIGNASTRMRDMDVKTDVIALGDSNAYP